MNFKRTKKFFVGIDSDGTVFDSMTVKHCEAFVPQMIEVWKLDNIANEVREVAVNINLYSEDRGIDRFKGLVKTFDVLKEKLGESFFIEDYSALREFTLSDFPMSNAGLTEYMKNDNSEILSKALHWSRMSDKIFGERMKNMPLFDNCKETIKKMSEMADIAVVSSASYESLEADWSRTGLMEYVTAVGGQEVGSKAVQLQGALKAGFLPQECLVIGDAPGDKRAAEKCGMSFYLIEPGRESESWKILGDYAFEQFIEHSRIGEEKNANNR